MIDIWNNIQNKPKEVNVIAKEGDIVEKINGVLFLLQTENEGNNIVAYRVEKDDKNIIWTLYEYIILLATKYNIEYVRIEGRKNRYNFLKRVFSKREVIQDRAITERDVYYAHLTSKVIEKLKLKCKEYKFYYTQNLYLNSTDEKIKKESFEKMFFMVHFAVEVALKKRLRPLSRQGVIRHDFDDLAMDATINVMNRYKKPKGYKVLYLLTTADYAALGILHNPRQKFWDNQVSYEAWLQYEFKEKE